MRSKNTYNYVIFHKGCLDGFTGFLILHRSGRIDIDASIHRDVPGAKIPPPNIEGKRVIIIDVAYHYEVLKHICNVAKSVVFIDHHVSIRDDVNRIMNEEVNKNHTVIYDEKKCGASLTWEFLYPTKKIPLFVKFVEDDDTGTWKMKNVYDFIHALRANYTFEMTHDNIKSWTRLFKTSHVNRLISKGKIYNEYNDYLLNENIKKHSLELFPSEKIYKDNLETFMRPGQYRVAVFCGSGCPSVSEVGAKAVRTIDCDFAIFWTLNLERKEYVLSFRSKEVDVGSIAKLFGGGGHKLASACAIPINKYSILDLFFPNSLPRAPVR